ncbi:MAG: apolipoprotein N-acyltransferase [Phycisphaeraceae bacterium]|nr:apolipoprotein N-acyltransferase [Phycisphaeraceae bacterium]
MARPKDAKRLPVRGWWRLIVAGLVFALFMSISLPPAGLWLAAFIAPLPMIWAGCRSADSPLVAALLFAFGSLPLWFFQQQWLVDVTAVGYPLLALYLSVCTGAAVYLIGRIRRRATGGAPIPMFLLAPVAIVAVEVLRGELLLTGYAWFLAAHPLIDSPALAAPAAILGTYFVSFLLLSLAGATADAAGWSGVPRSWGGAAAAAIAVIWCAASILGWRGSPDTSGTGPGSAVRIAVVQTNIPQSNKLGWTIDERLAALRRFEELTRQAAAARPTPDFIVWPETMFPGLTLSMDTVDRIDAAFNAANPGLAEEGRQHAHVHVAARVLRLQGETGVPMIVGAIAMPGAEFRENNGHTRLEGPRHNSAFLLDGGRVRDSRYDKVDLTPFGEVIPYVWRWPGLQEKLLNIGAAGMAFDLVPGTEPVLLPMPTRAGGDTPAGIVQIATPICFEVTRPSLCRWLCYAAGTRRAGVIVNLSNDGWFGPFQSGKEQHLLAARWRCVELGLCMARAVNTGVSAAIDHRGRVLDRIGTDDGGRSIDGVLVATLPVRSETRPTLYGRIGDVFAFLVLAAGAGWWLWRVVRG